MKWRNDRIVRPLIAILGSAAILIAITAFGAGSLADVVVRMKDGRTITMPIDSTQIDDVTVTPAQGGDARMIAPVQNDTDSAISRAARQRRDAEDRVRTQSDNSDESRVRAQRAAEAAEAARARAEAAAAAIERLRDELERTRGGAPGPERSAGPSPQPPAAQAAPQVSAPSAPSRPAYTPPAVQPPQVVQPPQAARSGTPAPAASVHRVGSGKALRAPSDAARVARSGDTVEIDAGVYDGDVAVWPQSNLTLRGVGGMVELRSAGAAAEGKAIWVLKGNNVTVENIDFSGVNVADQNGAGIRGEGSSITIRRSKFHDNQMGILVSPHSDSDIVIEESEFFSNTTDYARYKLLGHNIYVGDVRSFVLKRSYIHHASIGHNVKSRAVTNYILNNRIMDERDGSASYQIDLEAGGTAYIIGNEIHKSIHADNISAINFASARRSANDRLYVVNNTIVTDLQSGQFVQNRSSEPALVANNILVGRSTPISGPGRVVGNLIAAQADAGLLGSIVGSTTPSPASGALNGNWTAGIAGLRDPKAFDYRLAPNSGAIDRGIDLSAENANLVPKEQYVHPRGGAARRARGAIDIGAYEQDDGR